MGFANEIGSALKEMETFCGDASGPRVVNWMGKDFPCVPSPIIRGTKLIEAGFEVEITGQITVRKELFQGGPFPASGNRVVYSSAQHRIVRVTDMLGAAFELTLADANV